MRSLLMIVAVASLLATSPTLAQDRDTKVRKDRENFRASGDWIYNDMAEGVRAARAANKPLMVVFRCIPCEACQKFDDDVARRDPVIRDLLDRFVCVRIIQGNTIDLSRFQYDFDLSFAVFFLAPDLTVYGRFATRSERPEFEDISLRGLRKAMEEALRMHRESGAVKATLAGKQPRPTRFRTPTQYPNLAGRYGPALDYEGQVAKSCVHCHQIRDAERLVYRTASKPIPDEVLFPYPDPAVLGLKLNPTEMATVEQVRPDSPADRAGLHPGDRIVSLDGQPLLSIADMQWVLHNTPASARIPGVVRRGEGTKEVRIDLPEGWRRGDISWRATTWELRRMGLGGMRLEEISEADRKTAGLSPDALALRVKHLGEYGEHAAAKRAGFKKGDILVAFDGLTRRETEGGLLAHAVQQKRPGDVLPVTVIRDGARKELKLPLQ